jgi:methylase of polypeptide subunit release factors
MPTGTGIVSISVRKWTQAKKLVMVDTSEEVVGNAKNNCLRNKTADYVAVKMKWD